MNKNSWEAASLYDQDNYLLLLFNANGKTINEKLLNDKSTFKILQAFRNQMFSASRNLLMLVYECCDRITVHSKQCNGFST